MPSPIRFSRRLLIVIDALADHQPVTETSYVNIPVITFCNTDSPLKFVEIAIPCNTKSRHSIGLMWWLLACENLRLCGKIAHDKGEIKPNLFYRDTEEQAAQLVKKVYTGHLGWRKLGRERRPG